MRRRTFAVMTALLATIVPVATAQEKAEEVVDVYADFNQFCIAHFGAEKEPLVYEKFGEDLRILKEGSWRHVSEDSACIAWETNLPAKTHVEYGETLAYGRKTPEPERHFYIHVHYLNDLELGKTYHYQLVSVDERGKKVTSEDRTFTTKETEGAIHVPGDVEGPPFFLNANGKTYVLTEDIVANGTAFDIEASDVTLDLNGHTVTYNNVPFEKLKEEEKSRKKNIYSPAYGIHAYGRLTSRIRVLNGIIRQGAGNSTSSNVGIGTNPIYFLSGNDSEIAGVTVEYTGNQVTGICMHWAGNVNMHHNVVVDRGTEIQNRHMGCRAIQSPSPAHHNLIKRCRHRGISMGKGLRAYNNEIYIDSCATNAIGMSGSSRDGVVDGIIRDNRVFGTGYHAVAIFVGSGNFKAHDNFVHMQAVKPSGVWKEYGELSKVNGFRITWGGKDQEYRNNVVVMRGREGGQMRCIWFAPKPDITNIVVRGNILVALAGDKETTGSGAIVINGHGKPDAAPMLFERNRVVSNICNVRLGDSYGIGCNQQFVGNTFVRVGKRPDYATIRMGNTWSPALVSTGHLFVDNVFENGAGYDQVEFVSEQNLEFGVGHTLTVKTVPGAAVTIRDKTGLTVFSGEAGAEGTVRAALREYRQEKTGRTSLTPHQIMVQKDGKTAGRTVTIDRKQEIEIKP